MKVDMKIRSDILCNIKKHKLYLDIDYEELKNLNSVQSDEEKDDKWSMINPDLLDLDLEGSDSASNAPVASTIIGKYYFLINSLMKHFLNWMGVRSMCSILYCSMHYIGN